MLNTPNFDNPFSLTRKEAIILEMLITGGGGLFGLEMVENSNGNLKRGTIYVLLYRMKEKGLVDSKPEARFAPEIGIPRRLYWATGLGERAFSAARAAQSAWKARDLVPTGVL